MLNNKAFEISPSVTIPHVLFGEVLSVYHHFVFIEAIHCLFNELAELSFAFEEFRVPYFSLELAFLDVFVFPIFFYGFGDIDLLHLRLFLIEPLYFINLNLSLIFLEQLMFYLLFGFFLELLLDERLILDIPFPLLLGYLHLFWFFGFVQKFLIES